MNSHFTPIETTLLGLAYRHTNGVVWFYKQGGSHAEYFRSTKDFRTHEDSKQLGTKAQ